MNLWFKSYFLVSNSSQFLEITQMEGIHFTQYRYTSLLRKIVCGVPHCSIWGLIFVFIVYISSIKLPRAKLVFFCRQHKHTCCWQKWECSSTKNVCHERIGVMVSKKWSWKRVVIFFHSNQFKLPNHKSFLITLK
jgi:hypothetical protein